MSEGVTSTGPSAPDDWDRHWYALGDLAQENPANVYRRRLVLGLLGDPSPGSTIVDIGSGQGELALFLQATFPQSQVVGVEYSAEGVRRSRDAAAAIGSKARFIQRDLLQRTDDNMLGGPKASFAVCSEVLEHVDHPEILLENAASYLAAGCRMVVTVPGGPRSAFDRHIGHRRHFHPHEVKELLERCGFVTDRTYGAGFPFFDLYRLAVIARGKRLVTDVERGTERALMVQISRVTSKLFNELFRWNLHDSPLGWQVVAAATYTGVEQIP